MNTELDGKALDAAVAVALGYKAYLEKRGEYTLAVLQRPNSREPWKGKQMPDPERYKEVSIDMAMTTGFFGNGVPRFSEDWAVAGPLIQEHRISLVERGSYWTADMRAGELVSARAPLIAAMRSLALSMTPNVPHERQAR